MSWLAPLSRSQLLAVYGAPMSRFAPAAIARRGCWEHTKVFAADSGVEGIIFHCALIHCRVDSSPCRTGTTIVNSVWLWWLPVPSYILVFGVVVTRFVLLTRVVVALLCNIFNCWDLR